MFTGLIETVGTIQALSKRGNYLTLTIKSKFDTETIKIGESIACDGTCLTVIKKEKAVFTVEASQESIQKTILSEYRSGTTINLERALQVGDRMGGHFVSGHIDDKGIVDSVNKIGDSTEIAVRFNTKFDLLIVEKGSIAINGISLTVNKVSSGWFNVNIIPHTIKETTLKDLNSGSLVNLEFDLIGKYILKSHNPDSGKLTKDKIIKSGW